MDSYDYYNKYYLNDEEILEIAKHGIVVFDTSALLALYYYSDNARKEIYKKLMKRFKERLWIPAQVYFEYMKNKDKVLHKPEDSYRALLNNSNKGEANIIRIEEIIGNIKQKNLKDIRGQLGTLIERTKNADKHPFVNEGVYQDFKDALDKLENDFATLSSKADKLRVDMQKEVDERINELETREDDVNAFICDSFTIGPEYSFAEMIKIAEEGQNRYNEEIPPGYMDSNDKKGLQKYGDLYAWKQILSYSKTKNKSVLLVINDVKEDWWDKEKDNSGAPRIELLREFRSYTGKPFWSCDMSTLLYYINKMDSDHISKSTIDEVNEVTMEVESGLDEEYLLYRDILAKWLEQETEYRIKDIIPRNQDWRTFSKGYVFDAVDYQGHECRILLNIIRHSNHASVLHNIRDGFELKKYYERFGKEYRYRQIIMGKNKNSCEAFCKTMDNTPKLKRLFNNNEIENTLVYLDEGKLVYLDSNHSVG